MKQDNKTRVGRIKHILICAGLALFMVSIAVPFSVRYAQGEYAFPEYYPRSFDGTGRIDRLAEDAVVINDTLFKPSPDIEYHTPTTQNASSAWFKEGKFVGYMTNAQREIVSLWLIE